MLADVRLTALQRLAKLADRMGFAGRDHKVIGLVLLRWRATGHQGRSEPAAVRDVARIEEVLSKVKAAARKAGLTEAIAEPVWRTLIERCIDYEFEVWDQTKAS